MQEILLMIVTINPQGTPFVGIYSQQERLSQYLCSLDCLSMSKRVLAKMLGNRITTNFVALMDDNHLGRLR